MKKVLLGFVLLFTIVDHARADDVQKALINLHMQKKEVLLAKQLIYKMQNTYADSVVKEANASTSFWNIFRKPKKKEVENMQMFFVLQHWIQGMTNQIEEINHMRTGILDANESVRYVDLKIPKTTPGRIHALHKELGTLDARAKKAMHYKPEMVLLNLEKKYPLNMDQTIKSYVTDVNQQISPTWAAVAK